MKNLIIIMSFVLVFLGCKKKTETAVALDFAPNTVGTNWTYVQTQNGITSTFKLTVTNRDSTIGTRSYRVISNSIGSNVYAAKTGVDYYRAGFINLANAGTFEELYLKDGATVSTNWSQALPIIFNGFTFQVNLVFTIMEVGATKVVLGNTYNNVTRVRLDAAIGGLGTAVGGGDFLYAKGVGLISYTINTNAIAIGNIPAVNTTLNLQAHEIK